MKALIILRFLTLSIITFSTGLISGWWLSHNQSSNTQKMRPLVTLHDWQPQPVTVEEEPPHIAVRDSSEFKYLLNQLKFDDALVIYQDWERNSPEHLPQLKTALLSTVHQWQAAKQYQQTISALERFTQHYFDDQSLLDELSRAYLQQQEVQKALETLITARSYLIDPEAQGRITPHIQTLSKNLFNTHVKTNTLDELMPLFHKLAMQEQEFNFYRYALAECYLAAGDTEAAAREFELLQTDPEFGRKASLILASLTPPREEEADEAQSGAIPLFTHGQHLIASASLQDRSTVRLMIDTGASVTTLPDTILKELKRKKMAYRVGHTQLKTAGGFVFAPIYQLKEFHLGDYVLKNIEVAGLTAGLSSSHGLLGMNVLGQFHFQIDQDRRQLLLHPR